ncbi:MAG: hypothetical protein KA034_01045 [Candidatus Moranbacteria bacterium]|jgi:hypothetical protein|nr:hypothetical protein [Candidatus Moranbacteria bacterium]
MYFLHYTLMPIVGPTLLIIGALLASIPPIIAGTLGLLNQIDFDRYQKKIILMIALGTTMSMIGFTITWYIR